jgi:hypothetical protein
MDNPLGSIPGKSDLIKRQLMNRLDQEGRAVATLIAAREETIVEAANDLADTAGEPVAVDFDREERIDELLDAVRAWDDGELVEWWVRESAPLEDGEGAARYVGMDAEEWDAQIEAWAEEYRRQHGMEGDDREIANQHVANCYAVDLETFEEIVVDVDQEDAVEELLAGPINTAEAAIRTVERGL